MIYLRDYNCYPKTLYEYLDVMDSIKTPFTEETLFFFKSPRFGIKWFMKGKYKNIKGYEEEIMKIWGPIHIPHIHKLSNLIIMNAFPKLWTRSLIIPVFKARDKNNPSNYMIIMISPLLSKLYGIIIDNKIHIWLKSHGKRDKGQATFMSYHSTLDHLAMLNITVDEFCNNKINVIFFFIVYRKSFDIVPRTYLWNILK